MEENINIYDEFQRLNNKINYLEEQIKPFLVKKEEKVVTNKEFYTISEIALEQDVTRQTIYHYIKLYPLKKSGKFGRFDKYSNVDVNEWVRKCTLLPNKPFKKFKN